MAGNFSVFNSPAAYIMIFTGSADHMIGIPINCWALWLIVSGKRTLIESEILTLNLVIMELMFLVCFVLMLIRIFEDLLFIDPLIRCYNGMAAVGRALFQCHVCVDRYLAVVHPVVFIRYKQTRYRGACLAAVWLVVICSGLSNVFKPMNHIVLYICSFLLLAPALLIELFCSLSILKILRRPGPGDKKAQEKREGDQQKMRAAMIICIVLAMLVLNVSPFIAVPLLKAVVPFNDLITIAFTLSTIGSSVQAILFLSRSGKLPCKNKI